MALVPELNPQAFTNDSIVNFFGPHSNFGEPADVTPNGYASTDGLLSVSVLSWPPCSPAASARVGWDRDAGDGDATFSWASA